MKQEKYYKCTLDNSVCKTANYVMDNIPDYLVEITKEEYEEIISKETE